MSERDDLTEQAYHASEVPVRKTVTIDVETGEWLSHGSITHAQALTVASSVLPGLPKAEIEHAYEAYFEGPALPFSAAESGFTWLLSLQQEVEKLWGRDVDPTDHEAVSKYIREVILCTTDELHEVLAEVHWKPWKDSRGIKDISAYRGEMADVLHFILDLYLAGGISGREIVVDYLAKHSENIRRNKSLEYRAS